MPARILYASQKASINFTSGDISVVNSGVFPVQTASCEITTPIDDVFTFGILGSAGRFQKEPSTVKTSVKIFLALHTGLSGANFQSGTNPQYLSASGIATLTGNALNGIPSKITVEPNGFISSGILTNIGIDASNGQFVTCDLSFAGVGDPIFSAAPSTVGGSAYAGGVGFTSVTPVTSDKVYVNSGCPNSAKFSLDLPNEVLSCLGGTIIGGQGDIIGSQTMVGKPPFKATLSVEGTAATFLTGARFGSLVVVLPNAITTSKSFNQSVGDVGANYSFTIEDLTANFSDMPI